MQEGGLDGWLRKVPANDARPSSIDSGMPQWKFTTLAHQTLTRKLVDFILLDGHHVSAVEGPGLHRLLHFLEPRFEPPSRTYIQHVCLSPFFSDRDIQVLLSIITLFFVCSDLHSSSLLENEANSKTSVT